MGFDRVFNENAEQINNVLTDDVRPSVVLMNPPFSSTAGRTATNKTENAISHIKQALLRLEDGGRLVAILGHGMANNSPAFGKWWNKLRKTYDIRANIGIDGTNYKKYGTSFDVQLVVIDKTGPQKGLTITGSYKTLESIPKALEGIRNDRSRKTSANRDAEPNTPVAGSKKADKERGLVRTGDRKLSDAGASGSVGKRPGQVLDVRGETGNRAAGKHTDQQQVQPAAEIRISDDEHGAAGGGSRGDNVAGLRGDALLSQELVQSGTGVSRTSVRKKASKNDNGIYAEYIPAKLPVKGAKKHPAPLVESAAMASISAPLATYTPKLPQSLIDTGRPSAAQIENIVYAGQAHQQILPDGTRKGYFIGDGTGVPAMMRRVI